MNCNAVISNCQRFRYYLTREWDDELAVLGFVMLNPSTADADKDDPTIRKCIGFAKRLGFGSIIVTNLFAYRATSPKDLIKSGYDVGEYNDHFIQRMMSEVDEVVCAWGSNARGLKRSAQVLNLLKRPKALAFTEDGIPRHPLMLPYSCQLIPMENKS